MHLFSEREKRSSMGKPFNLYHAPPVTGSGEIHPTVNMGAGDRMKWELQSSLLNQLHAKAGGMCLLLLMGLLGKPGSGQHSFIFVNNDDFKKIYIKANPANN